MSSSQRGRLLNPKLQAPHPNHAQLPDLNVLDGGSCAFLELGTWEWLGCGAWSLGFDDLPALDLVLAHLAGDRVAVQAEQFRSVAHAAARPLERPGDEHLLDLPPRLVVADPPIEHLPHEA